MSPWSCCHKARSEPAKVMILFERGVWTRSPRDTTSSGSCHHRVQSKMGDCSACGSCQDAGQPCVLPAPHHPQCLRLVL